MKGYEGEDTKIMKRYNGEIGQGGRERGYNREDVRVGRGVSYSEFA